MIIFKIDSSFSQTLLNFFLIDVICRTWISSSGINSNGTTWKNSSISICILGNFFFRIMFYSFEFSFLCLFVTPFFWVNIYLSMFYDINSFFSFRLINKLIWRKDNIAQSSCNCVLHRFGPSTEEENTSLYYWEWTFVFYF